MFTPFLIAFVLVASAFGGAVLGLSWYTRQDDSERAPSELARALGLTPAGPHEAWGERDGVRVHVRWMSVRRGGHAVRVMRFWAPFDPPLGLGLEIGREGMLDGFVGILGASPEIEVGDPELDGALRIEALDRALVIAVVRRPDVKRALLRGARFGELGVSDLRVAAGHDGWADSPEAVRRGLDAVHHVAKALRDAQAKAA